MNSVSPATILSGLREKTRTSHSTLEAHIDLLNREWSLPFYQTLLQKFYGFYSVTEPAIFSTPEWQQSGLDTGKRQKVGRLAHDLQSLGLSDEEVTALPRCLYAPVPRNFAEALGCAYVFEGATLGGQIITRHLQRSLALEQDCCTFFGSYGACVGPMWQEFTGFLNSYNGSTAEKDALMESAHSTFVTFDKWLTDIL